MTKFTYLTLLIIFCLIKNCRCTDFLRKRYWNAFFGDFKFENDMENVQVETDVFRCYSLRKEYSKSKSISWICETKVHNVIWIPNKKLNENKYIVSMTDSLGEIYAVPYGIRKLLSICTSGNIEVFGEYRERNSILLTKNFVFLKINDCLNVV